MAEAFSKAFSEVRVQFQPAASQTFIVLLWAVCYLGTCSTAVWSGEQAVLGLLRPLTASQIIPARPFVSRSWRCRVGSQGNDSRGEFPHRSYFSGRTTSQRYPGLLCPCQAEFERSRAEGCRAVWRNENRCFLLLC